MAVENDSPQYSPYPSYQTVCQRCAYISPFPGVSARRLGYREFTDTTIDKFKKSNRATRSQKHWIQLHGDDKLLSVSYSTWRIQRYKIRAL